MSLGQSKGGLPPDDCVESEDAILRDCVRVIERYHDPRPGSMLQVVLAPCSPFSVTADLMREVGQDGAPLRDPSAHAPVRDAG